MAQPGKFRAALLPEPGVQRVVQRSSTSARRRAWPARELWPRSASGLILAPRVQAPGGGQPETTVPAMAAVPLYRDPQCRPRPGGDHIPRQSLASHPGRRRGHAPSVRADAGPSVVPLTRCGACDGSGAAGPGSPAARRRSARSRRDGGAERRDGSRSGCAGQPGFE